MNNEIIDIDITGFEGLSKKDLQALCAIAMDEGFYSLYGLLEYYHLDSATPSYCYACNQPSDETEPDQRQGWCSNCGQARTKSLLVIAGII